MDKMRWFLLSLIIIAVALLSACSNAIDFVAGEPVIEYSVRIYPEPENGTLKLSHKRAQAGTYVKVYVLPDPEYVLKVSGLTGTYRFTNQKFPLQRTTSYYYQIQMNANDIEITAEFEKNPNLDEFTVSVDRGIQNGFIVPTNESEKAVAPGAAVQLDIYPNNGFEVIPSSFKVMDAETGDEIPGVTVSPALPFTFTMPSPGKNVKVTVDFETTNFAGLVRNARSYLMAGKYDTAVSYYSEAYNLRSEAAGATAEDDLNEVIFYHSMGKLGSILLENKVRELLGPGKKRLHFYKVPASLDDWMCDTDAGWGGSVGGRDDDRWYETWDGIDYGNNTPEEKSYVTRPEEPVLWHPQPTLVYDEITIPKIDWRSSIDRDNTESNNNGGFAMSFPDYPLVNENRNTRQKFYDILFWIYLGQNREGFNDLLESVDERIFGATFEEAMSIAATLPDDAKVPLYPNLKNRFKLDKYYDGPRRPNDVDTWVGKAELDYIFGMLKTIKAAVQFLRAYDWTLDFRPWLVDNLEPGDGLDQILDRAFNLTASNSVYQNYWASSVSIAKILPMIERWFMRTQNAVYLEWAREGFTEAMDMINNSWAKWNRASGDYSIFSTAGKENYRWAREGFAAAKNSLEGYTNGNFPLPKKLPDSDPNFSWPNVRQADYAINWDALFTPNAFNLRNLIVMEGGLVSAPAMYKIRWFSRDDVAYLQPNSATRVTAPIPDDDSEHIPSVNFTMPYQIYTLEINTGNLRKIFPRGFEQDKYTNHYSSDDPNKQNRAFLYEVFPTIPLWPERPTYFTGPGSGNLKSAQGLYNYYHK